MTGPRITIADAAHLTHIPARTLYRWVTDERCTSNRVNGRTLVDLEEIEELADHRRSGRLPRIDTRR